MRSWSKSFTGLLGYEVIRLYGCGVVELRCYMIMELLFMFRDHGFIRIEYYWVKCSWVWLIGFSHGSSSHEVQLFRIGVPVCGYGRS